MKKDPLLNDVIGTQDAAELAELTDSAIKAAIDRGELPANKIGKTWILHKSTVKKFAKVERKPGRKPQE